MSQLSHVRIVTQPEREALDALDRNTMEPLRDRAFQPRVEGVIPSTAIRHIIRSARARDDWWERVERFLRALRPQRGNATPSARKWSWKRATLAQSRVERHVEESVGLKYECPHGVPYYSNCLTCLSQSDTGSSGGADLGCYWPGCDCPEQCTHIKGEKV